MTSYEIADQLGRLISEERLKTNEVLQMINIAWAKRAYLELGYSSMFDWLTKGFGYSNAAAYRRIESARLLKDVPLLAQKLETGEVNLSTLSKVQSVIKVEERLTGTKVSLDAKMDLIGKIENKSVQCTERVLLSIFPRAASALHQERKIVLNEDTTRHSINFNGDISADLCRLKEVLSHRFPNGTDAEIIGLALKVALQKFDPLLKKTRTSKASSTPENQIMTRTASAVEVACRVPSSENLLTQKPSQAAVRQDVIQKAAASCTFRDPKTGKVCGSRHQIQIDHVKPKALGGSDDPDNLRILCRQHNLLMAERSFGKRMMEKFRKPNS